MQEAVLGPSRRQPSGLNFLESICLKITATREFLHSQQHRCVCKGRIEHLLEGIVPSSGPSTPPSPPPPRRRSGGGDGVVGSWTVVVVSEGGRIPHLSYGYWLRAGSYG